MHAEVGETQVRRHWHLFFRGMPFGNRATRAGCVHWRSLYEQGQLGTASSMVPIGLSTCVARWSRGWVL
eukprot:15468500-Alexandrium_andersonii.AAC.1